MNNRDLEKAAEGNYPFDDKMGDSFNHDQGKRRTAFIEGYKQGYYLANYEKDEIIKSLKSKIDEKMEIH